MLIRLATLSDLPAVIALFQHTIMAISKQAYSDEQKQAWASRGDDVARWQQRITSQYFLVAEVEDIIGFGSTKKSGYLDTLYVHPHYQRRGVAQQLLDRLEAWVVLEQIDLITTEASIVAKPFFERNRYGVVKQQEKRINEILLTNYRMEKSLLHE